MWTQRSNKGPITNAPMNLPVTLIQGKKMSWTSPKVERVPVPGFIGWLKRLLAISGYNYIGGWTTRDVTADDLKKIR